MTASEKFSGYSIQIGSEDIIDSKVLSLIAEDAEGNVDTGKAERKLLDVLKETRVRIGTLLKTDNVSLTWSNGLVQPS